MSSKFVGGLLTDGLVGEIAQTKMSIQTTYGQEMELVSQEQLLSTTLNEQTANFMYNSEMAVAEASKASGSGYLGAGIADTMGGVGSFAGRAGREAGLGILGGKALQDANMEGQNNEAWKNLLHNGDAEAIDGEVANRADGDHNMTQEQIDQLKNGKLSGTAPKDEATRTANIKMLKGLRGSSVKDATGRPVAITPQGQAYDDMDKKLAKEGEDIDNRRQQYHQQTERGIQYLQTSTQAASHFSQAAGQYNASKAQEAQAANDRLKQVYDGASQGQKTAADMSAQAAQSTAGNITDLNRATGEILQANKL